VTGVMAWIQLTS